MKRRIVLLGPPGSGKGTIAEMLERKFDLQHVSTGQWFRKEMELETAQGKLAREYIERGELVPDELVLRSMTRWLTPELMQRGFLLDGFPRTCPQAKALDGFCAERRAPVEVVLYLNCPEEVILERIGGRRVCSACGRGYHVRALPPRLPGICDACGGQLVQRADDAEDVVRKRLAFYRKVTEPLVDYYRESDKLVSLNAALSSEVAFAHAVPVLES